MNFIYAIHLLYWKHLTDLIIHRRSNRSNSGDGNNKGARALRVPPFVVAVNAVVSVASAVYDQVSQVLPVQQVDGIDEVHQLDPVHQVDHKDEFSNMISLQKKHHKMDQPGFHKKMSNFF